MPAALMVKIGVVAFVISIITLVSASHIWSSSNWIGFSGYTEDEEGL
jgi:hypothetical protein